MNCESLLKEIEKNYKVGITKTAELYPDEIYIDVSREHFSSMCMALHKGLNSPVMTLFAVEEQERKEFAVICVFMGALYEKWFFVRTYLERDNPRFHSLSRDIYSASLFEREMKEMFGIEPVGSLDARRLRLHDEVCPENVFPLRKDFKLLPQAPAGIFKSYVFRKIEGEGVFEVPVGPVHAGIIGPGHFRFSCAGEPIINLEIRLGFTHRGVEKLLENKNSYDGVKIAECVSGDASFSHSLAYCRAIEKISGHSRFRRKFLSAGDIFGTGKNVQSRGGYGRHSS